jgi:metal-responsive CopG/Arc/MetJ family transcriptional regulator
MAAITRKPQAPPTAEHAREAAIQAVIQKGLASHEERQQPEEDLMRQVVVFVPESLLDEVDTLVKAVRPRTSRRAWLVEAIREKVQRDRDLT